MKIYLAKFNLLDAQFDMAVVRIDRVTVCNVWAEKKVVFGGSTIRNPNDEDNINTAVRVAFRRGLATAKENGNITEQAADQVYNAFRKLQHEGGVKFKRLKAKKESEPEPSLRSKYVNAHTENIYDKKIEAAEGYEDEPDDELLPCPECGEMPVYSDSAISYISFDCRCLSMPVSRGKTEAIARRRWNAAARIK